MRPFGEPVVLLCISEWHPYARGLRIEIRYFRVRDYLQRSQPTGNVRTALIVQEGSGNRCRINRTSEQKPQCCAVIYASTKAKFSGKR